MLFIGTVYVPDNIPRPLCDRLEVISFPGYPVNETREMAWRYLLEHPIRSNGPRPEQIELTDSALSGILRDYTREAGCRNLE